MCSQHVHARNAVVTPFIQAQGYKAECVGLYQDNISTQLLIKNGKLSSRKRTKHMKAKFFFIKDRVNDGEIRVVDCPTEEMWADVLTKPLQGMAFQTMRAELMNRRNYFELAGSIFTIDWANTTNILTWRNRQVTQHNQD